MPNKIMLFTTDVDGEYTVPIGNCVDVAFALKDDPDFKKFDDFKLDREVTISVPICEIDHELFMLRYFGNTNKDKFRYVNYRKARKRYRRNWI